MNHATENELKLRCGSFLASNNMKATSITGRKAVHAFWYGALVALDETTNPSITIRLFTGRHDELVTMPPKGTP